MGADPGQRWAHSRHTAPQLASSLSFPRVPPRTRNPKKSVGVSASPLQPMRHEHSRGVTHGSSPWAWPPCFMTCCRCGKLGRLAREKRSLGPETTYAVPASVSILLWGPALPLGRVNRCVCVCVLGNFSLRWMRASWAVTFPTLKL